MSCYLKSGLVSQSCFKIYLGDFFNSSTENHWLYLKLLTWNNWLANNPESIKLYVEKWVWRSLLFFLTSFTLSSVFGGSVSGEPFLSLTGSKYDSFLTIFYYTWLFFTYLQLQLSYFWYWRHFSYGKNSINFTFKNDYRY